MLENIPGMISEICTLKQDISRAVNRCLLNWTLLLHSWRRQWHPTPVLLPGKSHGWRSLLGCSPWGRWGLGTTEWLHFHFSLSFIGEGNGNPLQCSCLENPRDGEPGGLPSMGSHRVGHDWSDLPACTLVPVLSYCFKDLAPVFIASPIHWDFPFYNI